MRKKMGRGEEGKEVRSGEGRERGRKWKGRRRKIRNGSREEEKGREG